MKATRGFKRIVSVIMAVICVLTLVPFTTMASAVTVPAMKNVNAGERYTGVKIYWTEDHSVTGYAVYRSTDRKNWSRLKMYTQNTHSYYIDKTAQTDTLYFYRVRAYKKINGTNYYGSYSSIKKVFYGLNEYMTKTNDSVKISWSPINYGCDGYEIYMSTNGGAYKKVKTLTNYKTKSSTITGLDTKKNTYAVQLAAYQKTSSGSKNFRYYSDIMYSNSVETLINSTPKTVKPFTNYNYQGSSVQNVGKTYITDSDKKIFSDYESKFISTQMSVYWKMYYTLMYIHNTVEYAYDYGKVSDLTLTDAIFNKHMGQCLQYNGAMIAYLAYYGFDAALVMGYRGYSNDNRWQHFWGEVYLNGAAYVIETGNAGSDGTWHYFFTPYSQTRGYMKCGQVL